jgi:hypothetical protein
MMTVASRSTVEVAGLISVTCEMAIGAGDEVGVCADAMPIEIATHAAKRDGRRIARAYYKKATAPRCCEGAVGI